MAETKEKKTLTWQQKLEQGVKLSPLEEVQADATFNYESRRKEEKERAEFEARKEAARQNRGAQTKSDSKDDKKK